MMQKGIIFMSWAVNPVIDAFELSTSPASGHIGKERYENVYFSFLFIIILSYNSLQQPSMI
jgi:hypothetical protein